MRRTDTDSSRENKENRENLKSDKEEEEEEAPSWFSWVLTSAGAENLEKHKLKTAFYFTLNSEALICFVLYVLLRQN